MHTCVSAALVLTSSRNIGASANPCIDIPHHHTKCFLQIVFFVHSPAFDRHGSGLWVRVQGAAKGGGRRRPRPWRTGQRGQAGQKRRMPTRYASPQGAQGCTSGNQAPAHPPVLLPGSGPRSQEWLRQSQAISDHMVGRAVDAMVDHKVARGNL